MRISDRLVNGVRFLLVACLLFAGMTLAFCERGETNFMSEKSLELPKPDKKGTTSVEMAIASRRSQRDFKDKPLSPQQVAQLMWSAQGITGERGRKRAAPSAGATYPTVIFVAVGEGGVKEISAGVYRYVPEKHILKEVKSEDVLSDVAEAALGQKFIAEAPIDIIVTANYQRTARRYGERAKRYVLMEAGHVAQNIYLQAETLGLGTVSVGAFTDEDLSEVCGLSENLAPLYVMPVGYSK